MPRIVNTSSFPAPLSCHSVLTVSNCTRQLLYFSASPWVHKSLQNNKCASCSRTNHIIRLRSRSKFKQYRHQVQSPQSCQHTPPTLCSHLHPHPLEEFPGGKKKWDFKSSPEIHGWTMTSSTIFRLKVRNLPGCLAEVFLFCANNMSLIIHDLETTPGTSETQRKTERTEAYVIVPLLCIQRVFDDSFWTEERRRKKVGL